MDKDDYLMFIVTVTRELHMYIVFQIEGEQVASGLLCVIIIEAFNDLSEWCCIELSYEGIFYNLKILWCAN